MTARYLIGDVLEVLPTLEENSVDLILTSPPFLALRSYLPADHPDKAKEGGSQSTPGAFIDWLVDVVEALDRVLAPHGSMVIELGDTYSGSGEGGGDLTGSEKYPPGQRSSNGTAWKAKGGGWPADKSLTLIPELFRMTLVYGFNPLTGRQTKRWRLRNVVRWVRPNPPVGALGDKFRPATSELMVFCRTDEAGRRRYFDLDSVRSPHTEPGADRQLGGRKSPDGGDWTRDQASGQNPSGAPPLDWWNVPLMEGDQPTKMGPKERDRLAPSYRSDTKRQKGSNPHQGWESFVTDGVITPNPAGAPPLDWWNIPLLDGEEPQRMGPKDPPKAKNAGPLRSRAEGMRGLRSDSGSEWAPPGVRRDLNPIGPPPLDWWNIPPGGYQGAHYAVFPEALCVRPIKAMCPERVCRTCGEPSRRIVEREPFFTSNGLGAVGFGHSVGSRVLAESWSDCSHNNYRPGLVLDPFAGSGTTLAVAVGHGRDAIGIDLDERNARLAEERIGFFLEVVDRIS